MITTPFTFIASANSVLFTGAKPVFVDIDPETFNIDPEQVAQAVTTRTRANIPAHLYGYMRDIDALQAITDRHGLKVIEDACHGNPAGSIGTGIFYPDPAHQQEYMREIVGEVKSPVAQPPAKEVISLPVHPQLSEDDLRHIATEVNKL